MERGEAKLLPYPLRQKDELKVSDTRIRGNAKWSQGTAITGEIQGAKRGCTKDDRAGKPTGGNTSELLRRVATKLG